MKCNIILLSHSEHLARETKKYLEEMVNSKVKDENLFALGGVEGEDVLGTSPETLSNLIITLDTKIPILIFVDLGSAFLSAKTAEAMNSEHTIHIAQGSFVENSFAAYVTAKSGQGFQEILQAANQYLPKKD